MNGYQQSITQPYYSHGWGEWNHPNQFNNGMGQLTGTIRMLGMLIITECLLTNKNVKSSSREIKLKNNK